MKIILPLLFFIININICLAQDVPEKFINDTFNHPLKPASIPFPVTKYIIAPTFERYEDENFRQYCEFIAQDSLAVLLKCYPDEDKPVGLFYYHFYLIGSRNDICKNGCIKGIDKSDINQRMRCTVNSFFFNKTDFYNKVKSPDLGRGFYLGTYYDCSEVPMERYGFLYPDGRQELIKRGWDKLLEDQPAEYETPQNPSSSTPDKNSVNESTQNETVPSKLSVN